MSISDDTLSQSNKAPVQPPGPGLADPLSVKDLSIGGATVRHTAEARKIAEGPESDRLERLARHYAQTPDLSLICSTTSAQLEGTRLVSAANAILDDSLLADARERWPQLSGDEREGALRRAYSIYLDRTGYSSIAAPEIRFIDVPCEGQALGGQYDGTTIEMNGHQCVLGPETFEEAVGTLVHEHTHALQASETYRWLVREAAPDLAEALAANQQLGYCPPARSFEGYEHQPLEQHARSRKALFLAMARVRRR